MPGSSELALFQCHLHENLLGRSRLGIFLRATLGVSAVGVEFPGVAVVGKEDTEDFLQFLGEMGIFDGHDRFHPAIEVPGHPIGTPDVNFFVATVAEVKNARVFQKAPNDAKDANVFAQAGNAGAQATDAANDEIDLDACLGGFVENGNNLGIDEGVHFSNDSSFRAALLMGALAIDFPADEGNEAIAHVDRSQQQFAIVALARVAGQEVE